MPATIYDQYAKAFSSVSAYVICKNGTRIATVAFRFPRDDAGRLRCFAHVVGAPMVRGYATGYGYDKKSAAAESAFARIDVADFMTGDPYSDHAATLKAALAANEGYVWYRRIRDAGYDVFQAV